MDQVHDYGKSAASFYTWLPEWEGQWEGPMSLLLKFEWANCLSAHVLCDTLFRCHLLQQDQPNFHGRTLLAPRWAVRSNRESALPLARKISTSGLDQFAPSWFRTLASDAHLRFCPVCLGLGYQSALFQIDALAVCPIHGETIHEACLHCGSPTPRYALTMDSFETPFHCHACKKPYGGSFQPTSWRSAFIDKEATAGLIPLVHWLEALQERGPTWPQWRDWWGPWLDDRMAHERRVATFNALTQMIDVDIAMKCFKSPALPVRVSAGKLNSEMSGYARASLTGVALDEEKIRARQSIYKSIRRYVSKRMAGCSQTGLQMTYEPTDLSSADETLKLSLNKCMKAQCVTLWRLHFEEAGSLIDHPRGSLSLRSATLNWPWNGSADDAAWAGYVLTSLFASIETVRTWQKRAVALQDADLYGSDRAHAMSLYGEFALHLNVRRFPVFPQISVATVSLASNQLEQILFVVGSGQQIHEGSYFPLCDKTKHCSLCKRRPSTSLTCGGEHLRAARHHPRLGGANQNTSDIVIRPIERLVLPPNLDGSSGPYREMLERCQISAKTDLEALERWLESMETAEDTCLAYRREVERCLLWTVCERKKPLSALDTDDTTEYGNFLLNPQPANRWISAGPVRRSSDNWAPFRGPLSSRSREFSISVIKLFFDWLCMQGYVTRNPWMFSPFGLSRTPRRVSAPMTAATPRNAMISLEEWRYVALALDVGEFDPRQRLLIYLAYFSALKPRDLVAIRIGSYRPLSSDQDAIWQMAVPERDDGRTTVYLLPPARDALLDYLAERRFPVAAAENSPIFPDLPLLVMDPKVRPADLSATVKPVFVAAARLAEGEGKIFMARRLETAALGWLSNALETHAEQQNIPGDWPRRLLGAMKLVPASFIRYLPDCANLPDSEVLRGFRALQTFWTSEKSQRMSQDAKLPKQLK